MLHAPCLLPAGFIPTHTQHTIHITPPTTIIVHYSLQTLSNRQCTSLHGADTHNTHSLLSARSSIKGNQDRGLSSEPRLIIFYYTNYYTRYTIQTKPSMRMRTTRTIIIIMSRLITYFIYIRQLLSGVCAYTTVLFRTQREKTQIVIFTAHTYT